MSSPPGTRRIFSWIAWRHDTKQGRSFRGLAAWPCSLASRCGIWDSEDRPPHWTATFLCPVQVYRSIQPGKGKVCPFTTGGARSTGKAWPSTGQKHSSAVRWSGTLDFLSSAASSELPRALRSSRSFEAGACSASVFNSSRGRGALTRGPREPIASIPQPVFGPRLPQAAHNAQNLTSLEVERFFMQGQYPQISTACLRAR